MPVSLRKQRYGCALTIGSAGILEWVLEWLVGV
jgi:hypothetical protein